MNLETIIPLLALYGFASIVFDVLKFVTRRMKKSVTIPEVKQSTDSRGCKALLLTTHPLPGTSDPSRKSLLLETPLAAGYYERPSDHGPHKYDDPVALEEDLRSMLSKYGKIIYLKLETTPGIDDVPTFLGAVEIVDQLGITNLMRDIYGDWELMKRIINPSVTEENHNVPTTH